MSKELSVGQNLRTVTNETVTITDIKGNYIYVRYKSKIHERHKSIIGKKLFIISTAKKKEKKPVEKTCWNCMELRKGECVGKKEICDDYRFAPSSTPEERERWPKHGDATAFKRSDKRY